jgi:SsrA-binding protein
MANKKPQTPKVISNRRARFDYELADSLVAGIELSGAETKALRMGQGSLRGSYVTAKGNELWLINATIAGSKGVIISESDQTRTRKLLAKRREIDQLIRAKDQGLTIVPLEFLTAGRYIKVRISTGRGKKRYDKRQTLKKRESDRNIARVLKNS